MVVSTTEALRDGPGKAREKQTDPEADAAHARADRLALGREVLAAEVNRGVMSESPERPLYQQELERAAEDLGVELTGNPRRNFYEVALAYGRRFEGTTGVPALVTAGMACLESDCGQSTSAQKYFMFFGIKAQKGYEGSATPLLGTEEYEGGIKKPQQSSFRAYASFEEAFQAFPKFLQNQPRYKGAFDHTEPRAFLDELLKAGYAGKRDTPELRNRYLDGVEAKIRPFGASLGSAVEAPQKPKEDTEEQEEKTVWEKVSEGFSSLKDTLVDGFASAFEKVGTFFGAGDATKNWMDTLRKWLKVEKKEPKSPDSPERSPENLRERTPITRLFSFGQKDGATEAQDFYLTDLRRIRPEHPVTHKKNVPHEGIDFSAEIGTPIYLEEAATLLNVENKGTAGLTVTVQFPDGNKGEFMHLSKAISLERGKKLPKDTKIGDVGNTGRGTGPHLHFQLNDGNTDPLPYLVPEMRQQAEEKIADLKTKPDNQWRPLKESQPVVG